MTRVSSGITNAIRLDSQSVDSEDSLTLSDSSKLYEDYNSDESSLFVEDGTPDDDVLVNAVKHTPEGMA